MMNTENWKTYSDVYDDDSLNTELTLSLQGGYFCLGIYDRHKGANISLGLKSAKQLLSDLKKLIKEEESK